MTIDETNIITIRSVYGNVDQIYTISPCVDPKTGRLPAHVKTVDKSGDMILSEKDKLSEIVWIPSDEAIDVIHGTTFDLNKPIEAARWEAIKHSKLIVPERDAKDANGDFIIDGGKKRYGIAELYIDRPGETTKVKNNKKQLVHKATSHIYADSIENRVKMCKLLNKDMRNAPSSDVEDYLISIAEKTPNKIIDLYAGTDTENRMLLIDALAKQVIIRKNNLYTYGDTIHMGVTDDSVIAWLKQASNKNVIEMIKKEVYPEMYKAEPKETKAK